MARCYGDGHADVVQAKLASHGIKSSRSASLRPYPVSIAAGSVLIFVLAEDADKARDILGEAGPPFDQEASGHVNSQRRKVLRVAAVILVTLLLLSGRACGDDFLSLFR
ncbi:MAG: hypothetical protein C4521_13815 [Actinobacteria bacterium]|nr:MAG: hypothetical protein C4521_13815 [Actinomycetota bacterium]